MHRNCISGLVHLCFFITLCLLTLTFNVAGINLPPSCKFSVPQNGHTRQFDLSSLSKQGVWQAQVNSSVYVLVSVCGHLDAANADKCPDTGAAVCLTSRAGGNWTPLVPNAGRTPLVSNTLNESSNDFSLNFVGGQMCKNSKNFSTTIFFTCSQAEELVYLSTAQDECTLVLFWNTMAACVSNQEAVDSCVLHSGAGSFDLRPLHRPAGYAVRPAVGRQFELSLCMAGSGGRCVNGSVAACEVTGGSRQVIGLFGKHLLEYFPGSGLKLVYKTDHSGSHKKTEISLTCNYSAMTVAPVFLGAEDDVYKFEIETWAACVQWPVECHTYDTQGNKYDLKDLQKHVGNWEIPGNETGKKFIINVCAAVNLDTSYKMKGAGAAACSTNATGSRLCSSLGTLSTGPVKADQGPLVLHYTGGSPCQNGSLRYKTEISFVCARFEKGPEFLSKSNDCVYSFLWETPSACPIKYAVGKQCVVTEPTYNTHFDLRPLHNTRQDYSVHLDDGSFSLNVCGPLKEPCGGFQNASVCLRTGSKEIPIGWASDSLHYVDGRVAFELHGAECKPGNKSTVHIIMLCDYSVESVAVSVEYLSTDQLCTFFFVWHSRETCFPSREVDCKATDENGTVYDLSPLSLASSNHVFLHRDAAGRRKFTINVCRSVVVNYGTVCSPGSAICMENVSQPGSHNKLVNVGEVTDPPKFENGSLILRYMGGDICMDSGPPEMSSSIVFVCDPSAVETSPVLEKIKNCHYSFSWRTDVACPQRKQREPIPEDRQAAQASDCIAVNPATKFRFDLSPLKNIIYTFKNDHGAVFNISVCGGLPPEVCGEGVGVCQVSESRKVSLGASNSHLSYDGMLHLNYTGGDACLGGAGRRNTWLQFVCGPEGSAPGPSFVDELSDCTTVIAWNTELACERKVPCEVVVGDRLVSLASLAGSSSNYEVPVQGFVFYINVCRPIVPMWGLRCLASSSACVATRHTNGSLTDELSLGVPYLSPTAVNGGLVLKYLKGSQCVNSPGEDISTALYFVCDPKAGKGAPKFINLTDCQYQFDWKTSIVCPPENKTNSLTTTNNCSFHIEEKNVNIDLQPFADHGAIVKANSGKIFYVNPCLLKSLCDGVGVCKQEIGQNVSYGRTPRMVFNPNKELYGLRFTDGSFCSTGTRHSSEIRLECDPHEHIGKPTVQSEDTCSVVFTWKNSIMCFDDDSHTTQESATSSSTAGVVIAVLVGLLAVAAMIYFRKTVNRKRFRSRFNSLFNVQRYHRSVHYSKLDTSEEVSVMLRGPSPGDESGSDDDELLGL